MVVTVQLGTLDIKVTAEPLTSEAFAPFGDVISNPRPGLHPADFASQAGLLPPNAVSANQGTAIQYRDVSNIRNLYSQAPGSSDGEPKMSMFSSAARQLESSPHAAGGQFNVWIMERHPFTTQTFTPISSSASDYLVIVAPSLPPSAEDEHLPVPAQGSNLPGRGLPNVRGLKAFVANGTQAVTYGAGTWHSPMVTLGKPGTTLEFVVSQFASGEPVEDCQLVEFESTGCEKPRITVLLPQKVGIRERL